MNRITLYDGGETTGSPADRVYSSRRLETTGGVGEKPVQVDSAKVDNKPDCDTVCFKGREDQNKKGLSLLGSILITLGAAAIIIGGSGLAYKNKLIQNMNNGKAKELLMKGEPALKTCYDWCSESKSFAKKGYDQVSSFFHKK